MCHIFNEVLNRWLVKKTSWKTNIYHSVELKLFFQCFFVALSVFVHDLAIGTAKSRTIS